MRLKDMICETVNDKYVMSQPIIHGKKLENTYDVYLPSYLYNNVKYHSDLKYAYSPNAKNFTQDDIMEIDFDTFSSLAYNKYEVNFRKISLNAYSQIVVVGYGGFMSNMMYFINEIARMQGKNAMFKINYVYENDVFTAMNSVRTFKDTSRYESDKGHKLDMAEEFILNKRYQKLTIEDINEFGEMALFIGSPDFETRKLLQNRNFLFFGNSNSDFTIYKSPVIDSAMTRETYGKLNIVEFWVGVLEATYAFLHLLENNDSDEIFNMEPNKEIWSVNVHKPIKKVGNTVAKTLYEEEYMLW